MFWKSKNNEICKNNINDTLTKSTEKLFNDVSRIRKRYPDKVPVVIHMHQSSHNVLPPLDKNKFIIPLTFTVAQLLLTIRKRIDLTPEKALFIFSDNTILPTSTTMQDLLNNTDDEYLEFTITAENTFGNTECSFHINFHKKFL